LREWVVGLGVKRSEKMSRELKEREPHQNLTAARKKQHVPKSLEYRIATELRLKREEAEARWSRQKEMIVIVSIAYISLGSFTVWAIVLLSVAYSSPDKMLLTGFIIQLLTNLFLYLAGKKPSWKS
jgi:hypothetical protein